MDEGRGGGDREGKVWVAHGDGGDEQTCEGGGGVGGDGERSDGGEDLVTSPPLPRLLS